MQAQTRAWINLAIQRALETNPVADDIAEEIREFQKTGPVDRELTVVWGNNCLFVHLNHAVIPITGLNIVQQSNMVRPYRVLGPNGAAIALTVTQTLQLIAEWLKASLPANEAPQWESRSATFNMKVCVRP